MKLTARERQLLDAASNGKTDRQISDDLNISIETVSSYWRGIRLKFQAANRTECVARFSQQKAEHILVKHDIESSELLSEIRIRTEAQAKELAQKNMLAAITDASLKYIEGKLSIKESFESLLQDVLNLTYSEYGFIGEVLCENGMPYLQEHALTNIAWNEETRALYALHHEQGLKFKNLRTLFGAVMTTKNVVIANHAPSDPRGGGIPPGHPALDAFLGIPVFQGKEMIGMIGLANREGGYTEDIVDFLRPLITSCATFILAHRLRQERRAMLKQIADSEALSRDIIALAPTGLLYESIDRHVQIVNQAFLNMFRIPGTPDDQVGKSCDELCESLLEQFVDPAGVIERIDHLMKCQETVTDDFIDFVDGRRYQREFMVMRTNGSPHGYLWRYRDITRTRKTRATDLEDEIQPGPHI